MSSASSSVTQNPSPPQAVYRPIALAAHILRRKHRSWIMAHRCWEIARLHHHNRQSIPQRELFNILRTRMCRSLAYAHIAAFKRSVFCLTAAQCPANARPGDLFYAGMHRVARALSICIGLMGRVELSDDMTHGGIPEYKASLYRSVRTYLSRPLRNDPEGNPRPSSRATVTELAGYSAAQQRRAERQQGIRALPEYATAFCKDMTDAEHKLHRFAVALKYHPDDLPRERFWTERRGKWLHIRIPNSYRTGEQWRRFRVRPCHKTGHGKPTRHKPLYTMSQDAVKVWRHGIRYQRRLGWWSTAPWELALAHAEAPFQA